MIEPIDIADSALAVMHWIHLAEHRMQKLSDVDQREVKRIVSRVILRLERLKQQAVELNVSSKMFRLKNLEILNLDPMLEEIAWAVYGRFGLDRITSGYRPGDKGVHGTIPLRGLDLGCRAREFGKEFGFEVASWVNKHFSYDFERPDKKCAIYHDLGGGFHIHLQTHDRTKQIK